MAGTIPAPGLPGNRLRPGGPGTAAAWAAPGHSAERLIHSAEWTSHSGEWMSHSREWMIHSLERTSHSQEWTSHSPAGAVHSPTGAPHGLPGAGLATVWATEPWGPQGTAALTPGLGARHSYYIHGNGTPPNGGSCQVVASLTYRYPTHRIV